MALTITSPGVQINEKDLSLRATLPVGTSVVVPGFASQGPTSEPLSITSVSELESTYGLPTTPAERYFYYSCREVLNSPASLTTLRLPYGSGTGAGFSSAYSGLFYPMTSANGGWTVGAPIHKTLSVTDYQAIESGNFNWGTSLSTANVFGTTYNTETSAYDVNSSFGGELDAGFIVLNDLQTSVNELGEGYYVGLASNIGLSADSVVYNSILTVDTLTATDTFAAINTARLDFVLSATQIVSDSGVLSVSETLQKASFVDYGTNEYSDHVSLGVFKIRRSTVDASVLDIINVEKFIGSFDSTRQKVSPTGGTLANAFIGDVVNNSSSTIKVVVNPAIANAAWYNSSTNTRAQFKTNSSASALFALGAYTPETTNLDVSKIIGDVPSKLDNALRTVESTENSVVDIVIDAGLSTIYSTSEALSLSSFDDTAYVSDVSMLNEGWTAVADVLVNFSENTRKDCITVIDPSRQIFVTGKDLKTINVAGNTFTANLFNPLKNQVGQFSSNYAATYGNWVKVNDLFSGNFVWVPFSGYAAAVFARNDQTAQTWSAPAGLNRGTFNTVDIAFNPNQKQRDRLYEISVNPVVFFNGDGYAIYGQKTLQTKPTSFDRLNVRRLFLTLERSVQRSLKYFVFEPNTDFTRARLVNAISPIFDYAKTTEGLYDYQIIADTRNNTPDIIDQNQLVVDIYLKPVRTAEYILVNFIATRTGQSFAELI